MSTYPFQTTDHLWLAFVPLAARTLQLAATKLRDPRAFQLLASTCWARVPLTHHLTVG